METPCLDSLLFIARRWPSQLTQTMYQTKPNRIPQREMLYSIIYEQHTASYAIMVLLAMTTNLYVHLLDALRIARRPRCLYNVWVVYR